VLLPAAEIVYVKRDAKHSSTFWLKRTNFGKKMYIHT
jgi:hypothetical protein